jgi:hydrogenase expression/formation protein HypE
MKHDRILLEHGSGGLLSNELVTETFLPHLKNPCLDRLEDSAVFHLNGKRYCFTTDSYVVNPLFFPGGDIGSLAVHGTINDLAVAGGRPLFLSAAFILEEGFPMDDLERIVKSLGRAAAGAGVFIATGDTKVVPRGAADRLFINTAGIGEIRYPAPLAVGSIRPGDAILVSGFIGDHGAAILASREDLTLSTALKSDSAPLNGLVESLLEASPRVHAMRDATRGGLGGILAEIASRSGFEMTVEEKDIPLRDEVRGICEIMGIEAIFLANEGKLVLFCPEEEAPQVLSAMKSHPLGRDGAVIGRVLEHGPGRLILNNAFGGSREIDLPTGELVPRIC